MRKLTHIKLIGTTRTGKTTYLNQLHRLYPSHLEVEGRRVPRFSIFIDTKGVDRIWGAPIRRLDPMGQAMLHGQKLVYRPPRLLNGLVDWPTADAQLLGLWGSVQTAAQRTQWTDDKDPWVQLVIDEAHEWVGTYQDPVTGKRRQHPPTVYEMASRGLGMGLRLVYASQYPTTLSTKTRDNFLTTVIFGFGEEAKRTLGTWYPDTIDQLEAHTRKPYHFATHTRENGWRFHGPIPTGQAAL